MCPKKPNLALELFDLSYGFGATDGKIAIL